MGTLRLVRTVVAASLAGFGWACDDTPTSPSDTSTGPPYTVSFASTLAPGGTASRTLVAAGTGVIAVTLDSTSPADLELSIGVGIPTTTRGGCSLASAAIVTPGATPQLELAIDAGNYCVQVSDPARLPATVSFAVTVEHP